MGEKVDVDRLRKLLTAAQEQHAKTGTILEEIERQIGGGVPIGKLLGQAEEAFSRAWATRYAGRYQWQYAKDRPHMKRFVLSMGVEELTRRFSRFIRDEDPFFTKTTRHSFGSFVSSVNRWADDAAVEDLTLEDDGGLELCIAEGKHRPPCRTDAEHTRRRQADMGLR